MRVERIKASWHGSEADATISADDLSAVFCSVTPEQVNAICVSHINNLLNKLVKLLCFVVT